jgi:hypothetical protein
MPLTARQAFKVAFLQRCAERGLSMEETHQLVKTAIVSLEKQSFDPLDFAINTGKSIAGMGVDTVGALGSAAVPLALLGPPAVGGLAAYTAAQLSDVDDDDITDIKLREKVDAYRRAAETARARTAQTRQQSQRSSRRFRSPL